MTDIKRWAQLKKQAYQGDTFVTVEAMKERLGYEYAEFVRLNHLIMEQVHEIYNKHMLDRSW